MNRMHSPESEAAIVGGLLQRNDLIDTVSEKLLPEHFATGMLRDVYAEACSQISRGKPCDLVTVYEALKGKYDLADLAELAQVYISAPNMSAYADIVIERAKSRQLAAASVSINDLAHETSKAIDERLEAAQAELAKLVQASAKDEWIGAHAGMIGHLDTLEARAEGRMQRWSTGLSDLDRMLDGGFCPGDLVIVGARPSHGKTAFGMTVGLQMAAQRPVAMLSMKCRTRS